MHLNLSALKRKEILTPATTRLGLEDIILREIQSWKVKYCTVPPTEIPKGVIFTETVSTVVFARHPGQGKWKVAVLWVQSEFCNMEEFWKLVVQQNEYASQNWTTHINIMTMVMFMFCISFSPKLKGIWKGKSWLQVEKFTGQRPRRIQWGRRTWEPGCVSLPAYSYGLPFTVGSRPHFPTTVGLLDPRGCITLGPCFSHCTGSPPSSLITRSCIIMFLVYCLLPAPESNLDQGQAGIFQGLFL